MSHTARLLVNGEDKEFVDGAFPATILELLNILGLDAKMVVAEVNGDIVRRQDFASHALASGDKVELVRFVSGG